MSRKYQCWLEGCCPTVPYEVMCHDFAVVFAVEGVVAPCVVLCSAFADGRVCRVKDGKS